MEKKFVLMTFVGLVVVGGNIVAMQNVRQVQAQIAVERVRAEIADKIQRVAQNIMPYGRFVSLGHHREEYMLVALTNSCNRTVDRFNAQLGANNPQMRHVGHEEIREEVCRQCGVNSLGTPPIQQQIFMVQPQMAQPQINASSGAN